MKLNHIISRHLSMMILGFLVFGAFSCYPGDITIEEADIVSTNYVRSYFDGNSPSKYFMPDTVVVIGDATEIPQLDRDEMDFILAQVSRNFDALGYERITKVEEGNLPDVVVTVSALVVNVKGAGCIPWYPGWGWGPWYPGWGWGPGYCYPTYLYSYDTGTLAIDMISPVAPANGDDEFYRVWEAGLNGILRSNVQGNENFVRDGVDKAFELSPYLKP